MTSDYDLQSFAYLGDIFDKRNALNLALPYGTYSTAKEK